MDEFGSLNDLPGWTCCATSDGGWWNGCWNWKDACLFYRTAVRKNNEKRFYLYECDSWTNELALSVTVEIGLDKKKEAVTTKYLLKEGESDMLFDGEYSRIGRIEVVSVEEGSGIRAMRSKFIQNDHRIGTMIREIELKIPLTCDDKNNCTYRDVCDCKIGASEPSCRCENFDYFKMTENGLPIIKHHYQLLKTDDNTPAIKYYHPRTHLQIELERIYDISAKFNNVTCEISDYTPVRGCYNCERTANFNVTCKSKVKAPALLTCNNRQFFF